MKIILPVALLLCLTSFNPNTTSQPVAVIELFTSEGCSSCPPADELLAKTIIEARADNRKIYALAFHVDYWNRLGWRDTFSTLEFTKRQQDYVSKLGLDGAYTPQMIINGRREFVGSDENALNRGLDVALSTNSTATFTTLTITSPLQVHYELEDDFQNCDIHFALVSLHESTAVKRGENGGRTLNHANVVRQFIATDAQKSGDIKFADYPVPAKNNWSIIAFVQRKNDGRIMGAGEAH